MQQLDFYTLDVFTDQPFAGNPLAVFPDAANLPTSLMAQIARELNLSETVFVGQVGAGNRFALRILTPAGEIPFAGHPTIGTALLLLQLGRLGADLPASLVLDQRVGPVEVQISPSDTGPVARLRTAQLPKVRSSALSRADAAGLIGLEPELLVSDPVIASCGLPFHLLEIRDVTALSQAALDLARWRQLLSADAVTGLYCFARIETGGRIRARMFDPGKDILEDPATGSAAAALAGYLAVQNGQPGVHRVQIEQGIEMGRASLIDTQVLSGRLGVEAVYVAGQARLISRGCFLLD